MDGARDFARLFKTGQYGRLYITSGHHARGNTFHIQVLPVGEKAIGNGPCNLCLNKGAVEVYGVISGNPGWTESYGWLHEGKWQDDFMRLVAAREKEITEKKADDECNRRSREIAMSAYINQMLSDY